MRIRRNRKKSNKSPLPTSISLSHTTFLLPWLLDSASRDCEYSFFSLFPPSSSFSFLFFFFYSRPFVRYRRFYPEDSDHSLKSLLTRSNRSLSLNQSINSDSIRDPSVTFSPKFFPHPEVSTISQNSPNGLPAQDRFDLYHRQLNLTVDYH